MSSERVLTLELFYQITREYIFRRNLGHNQDFTPCMLRSVTLKLLTY